MIRNYALAIAAFSLGAAVSATGALAQTYVAPGGSPIATAPGGSEGRSAPFADGRYDGLTTGSTAVGRPSADDRDGSGADRLRAGETRSKAWVR